MFTEEQVKLAKEFGQLLGRKAKFDQMSAADCIELVKYLQFYNKLVVDLESHVFEVKRVVEKPAKKSKVE
jgi:hypothetical protein